ncbi:MAG: (E)-4-hydroxy-3-methylbut-2-enyl-diphosphate synthase, partial [Atribacterota bacterium]
MKREETIPVQLGSVIIGGTHPVSVEAMGRTNPASVDACLAEILSVMAVGADVFRVAVPDEEALDGLLEVKKRSPLPLVADIHFCPEVAVRAALQGVEGIRVNPGTLLNQEKYSQLIDILRDQNLVLRLGANAGALPREHREKDRVEGLFESISDALELPEKKGFSQIILSAKSTEVEETIAIYDRLSRSFPYPLHVGLTEAGEGQEGIVKSSIALGTILRQGIGNNIRVSLTSRDPVDETQVANYILRAVGLHQKGIEVISCPTCARRKGDVVLFVQKVKKAIAHFDRSVSCKVAVMGCEVNGPGEAREADLGLAFGPSTAVLFE